MVISADKGNSTVIMNKTEYVDKCIMLLSGEKVYKRLNKDPTNQIQNYLDCLISK